MKDGILYEAAIKVLPEYRRVKTEKLKQERDRRLSAGAGLLIRYCLRKAGISEDKVLLGNKGKPYIEGENVFFNVSHSGEYAICAVSDIEIGCDIEKIAKANMTLAKKCFSGYEYESLCGCETEEERNNLFYRYWTMRESYVKALGTGIATPFGSFGIFFEGKSPKIRTESAEFTGCLNEVEGPDGYCCSVCTINRKNGNDGPDCGETEPEIEVNRVELQDLLL